MGVRERDSRCAVELGPRRGVLLGYGVGQRLQLSKRMDRMSKMKPKLIGMAILAKTEATVWKPKHKSGQKIKIKLASQTKIFL